MTPKKKRTYFVVADQDLYCDTGLMQDKDFANTVARHYNEDSKIGNKNKKFKVLRVTLTASPAGWK